MTGNNVVWNTSTSTINIYHITCLCITW